MMWSVDVSGEMTVFEVKVGESISERHSVPLIFAKTPFMKFVRDYGKDSRPMQVKCILIERGEDETDYPSMKFSNQAYVNAFPDEFKEVESNGL